MKPIHHFIKEPNRRLRSAITLLCLLSCWFLSQPAFAINDSTYHHYNPRWTRRMTLDLPDDYRVVDTSLAGLQRYNFIFDGLHLYNGNFGSAAYGLTFRNLEPVLFDIGFHTFDGYMMRAEDIPYYKTQRPFTQLQYVLGLHNEQMLTATHTRNIGRQMNFSIGVRRMGSDGQYRNERTDLLNTWATFSATSKNERYQLLVSAVYNNVKSHDNGGVQNADSVFLQTALVNKQLAEVNLDSAYTHWRETNLHIYEVYNLGRKFTHRINDTTKRTEVQPYFRLVHQLSLGQQLYVFYDDSSDFHFYDHVYYNDEKTQDTWLLSTLSNSLEFQVMPGKSGSGDSLHYRWLTGSLGLSHQLSSLNHEYYISQAQQLMAEGNIATVRSRRVYFYADGKYALLQGQGMGDYHASACLIWKGLYAGGCLNRKSPDAAQQQFYGNHFQWSNPFIPQVQRFAELGINRIMYTHIGVRYTQTAHYIYYAETRQPLQLDSLISGFSVYADQELHLGRLHVDSRFTWQKYDHQEVLHLPALVGWHSVYLETDMFKHAMHASFGADVFYASSFFLPRYIGAAGQYFLQRSETNDFSPVIDLFFNFKIKAARLFIRVNNIAQGVIQPGWYGAYQYPMPDRSVQFGVNWMLWN